MAVNRIVSMGSTGYLRIWDADIGDMLTGFEIPASDFRGLPVFCCCKNGYYLAGSKGFILYVWNLSSTNSVELLQTINAGHRSISVLSMHCDGSRMVTGHRDGYLCYWDIDCGGLLWSHNIGGVTALDISIDGTLIASSCGNTSILGLYCAETGEAINRLEGHLNTISKIKFSPDDSKIASSSSDQSIRIWNVATRSQLMLLEGHTATVTSVSYAPDGSRVASVSLDNAVRIWDAETGVCLFVLLGHTYGLSSVSFSSDGSRIVSGGEDDRIVFWDCTSGREIMRVNYPDGLLCVDYLYSKFEYLLK